MDDYSYGAHQKNKKRNEAALCRHYAGRVEIAVTMDLLHYSVEQALQTLRAGGIILYLTDPYGDQW
jgi:hypothetical protein